MRPALILATLLVMGTAGEAAAQASGQRPAADNSLRDRQLICRGGVIPAGWVLVDDTRSPTMCGGENPAIIRLYNVWVIERIDRRPVGTEIEVCAAMPTPMGWDVVDVYRKPELCGHPTDQFLVNVKRVRRVR